ncbi:MAG: hypothetical protein ACRCWI_08800 [Brevinema sp.]
MLLVLVMLMVTGSVYGVLEASYDGGKELILIERIPIISNKHTIDRVDYSLDIPTFSIYYNQHTTNYYFVEDGSSMIRTNGFIYTIDTNRLEMSYTGEQLDPFLTFVGYISNNMRLYIDNRNKQQYIKVLIPIKDSHTLIVRVHPPLEGYQFKHISYLEPGDDRGAYRYYDNKGQINLYENFLEVDPPGNTYYSTPMDTD